jgi:oxygen-independent coproporphyrinogen-3 oxidase
LNYWEFGDYLGIGAGAHSKLSFVDHVLRQARLKHPTAYIESTAKNAHIESEHRLTRQDLGFEFMMNALRLTGGFDVTLFQERSGIAISQVQQALAKAEAKGLIERDHLHIAPTLLGQRFLNELLQMFLNSSP